MRNVHFYGIHWILTTKVQFTPLSRRYNIVLSIVFSVTEQNGLVLNLKKHKEEFLRSHV